MAEKLEQKVRITGGSNIKMNSTGMKIFFTLAGIKEEFLVSQEQVAKQLNLAKTTVNYHIKKLQKDGLINPQLKITERGKKAIQFFKSWDKTFSKKLRAHNLLLTLFIPISSEDITHTFTSYQPFTNKRYKGLKFHLKGSTLLHYSDGKLLVRTPDIFGNNLEEILAGVEEYLVHLIEGLTQEIPKLKNQNLDYKLHRYETMHVAILNSVIAESHLIKKGTLYHSKNGLRIDNSHGNPELELEIPPGNKNKIKEDIETLVSYEDLARENKRLKETLKKEGIPI